MLQNATPLRESATGPPSISDEHVSCTAEKASLQILQMTHACPGLWKCSKTFTFCSLLTRCTIPCACQAKRHLNVVRTPGVFNILISKCASRHNGVHFSASQLAKSGPNLVWFVLFDFEMCFAPQRRALFRHLNFQKWSDNGVFCAF